MAHFGKGVALPQLILEQPAVARRTDLPRPGDRPTLIGTALETE
jgi:hypothetical protein